MKRRRLRTRQPEEQEQTYASSAVVWYGLVKYTAVHRTYEHCYQSAEQIYFLRGYINVSIRLMLFAFAKNKHSAPQRYKREEAVAFVRTQSIHPRPEHRAEKEVDR